MKKLIYSAIDESGKYAMNVYQTGRLYEIHYMTNGHHEAQQRNLSRVKAFEKVQELVKTSRKDNVHYQTLYAQGVAR